MQQITPQFIKECLQTKDDYKQKSDIIIQAVKDNQEHLFETICITLINVLELKHNNDPNPPISKLFAVKLCKDLIDQFNMRFVNQFEKYSLESFKYYSSFGFPNDKNRGKTLFGENQDKDIAKIGTSLVLFTSECIKAWAQFFPETLTNQPTNFMNLYQDMQSKGYQFPNWTYYKEEFVLRHSKKQIGYPSKGTILQRQQIYVIGCYKLLETVNDICQKNEQLDTNLFIKYMNEIKSQYEEVDMLVNLLRGVKEENLAIQSIQLADKLKELEKDINQLNRNTQMGFRIKYNLQTQNENLQRENVQLRKQLEEQINKNYHLQQKYDQEQQEKREIQEQLSITKKNFNNYLNSEKAIQQQKDQYNLEKNNYVNEIQNVQSEKQKMQNQIEQLNAQIRNAISLQKTNELQLNRQIEDLQQEIKNLQNQCQQNELKLNEYQKNQVSLTISLNKYKKQAEEWQTNYYSIQETLSKEKSELQQQLQLKSQEKKNNTQQKFAFLNEQNIQLEFAQYQGQQSQRNNQEHQIVIQKKVFADNLLNLHCQQTVKEETWNLDDSKQNRLMKSLSRERINKPNEKTLQSPIDFQQFPSFQKFTRNEVQIKQTPTNKDFKQLIFPQTPKEYFKNKPQKQRKGKEINIIYDFDKISHLSKENEIYFKQRCLGFSGILYRNSGIEFGLSYKTQVLDKKSYFTYGLYINNQEGVRKELKVEFLEVEKFQKFWASNLEFRKYLIQHQSELIEILIESKVNFLEVLTLGISLSENKGFQISIPIFICQQIAYKEINGDSFKTKRKEKYTNRIRTSKLKLNKQLFKDVKSFMMLIPKMIILNQNKLQEFEYGINQIKFGCYGQFQDITFLVKFEILPNDTFYIYLSYKPEQKVSQKEKLELILKGYAFILEEIKQD